MKKKRKTVLSPEMIRFIRGGYTQKELSEILDVSERTIQDWEAGLWTPGALMVEALLALGRMRARREGFNLERELKKIRLQEECANEEEARIKFTQSRINFS